MTYFGFNGSNLPDDEELIQAFLHGGRGPTAQRLLERYVVPGVIYNSESSEALDSLSSVISSEGEIDSSLEEEIQQQALEFVPKENQLFKAPPGTCIEPC